jgi:hypothetical protein
MREFRIQQGFEASARGMRSAPRPTLLRDPFQKFVWGLQEPCCGCRTALLGALLGRQRFETARRKGRPTVSEFVKRTIKGGSEELPQVSHLTLESFFDNLHSRKGRRRGTPEDVPREPDASELIASRVVTH